MLEKRVHRLNLTMKNLAKELDIGWIDNSNINESCLGFSMLHLNKALAKRDEKFNEQCSTFVFCKCLSRLGTLFDDKSHVGQCSALFENHLMKIKRFLELFLVLPMFVAFGHSDEHFNEQRRFSNARKRI